MVPDSQAESKHSMVPDSQDENKHSMVPDSQAESKHSMVPDMVLNSQGYKKPWFNLFVYFFTCILVICVCLPSKIVRTY